MCVWFFLLFPSSSFFLSPPSFSCLFVSPMVGIISVNLLMACPVDLATIFGGLVLEGSGSDCELPMLPSPSVRPAWRRDHVAVADVELPL